MFWDVSLALDRLVGSNNIRTFCQTCVSPRQTPQLCKQMAFFQNTRRLPALAVHVDSCI